MLKQQQQLEGTMAVARGIEISEKQVENAVTALKKVQEHWLANESRKAKLLGEDENSDVFLQVSLKKIPEIQNTKKIKIYLSHWPHATREVCLFTGDLDKKNPRADCEETVRFYKQLLKIHNVTGITDVISLRELRTDYKEYEAKRKLYGAYDTFLSDKKIGGLLPRVLGKFFLKNRKFPQQVDLGAKDLKKEIATALAHTICFLSGRGSSCSVYVGSISQPVEELKENIMSAIVKLSNDIPGTGKNIQQMHVKCAKSLAIPFYFSFESANEIHLLPPSLPDEAIEDELTTLQKSKVKVFPDGEVNVLEISDSDVSEIDELEKEILENEKKIVEKKLRRKENNAKIGKNANKKTIVLKSVSEEKLPRKKKRKTK